MAICITFGLEEFTSQLQGYENVVAYCYNCHNWNAHCVTRWPWFTVCFIPVIPLSFHKYREVTCYTCRATQDLRDRPDITPATRPPQFPPYMIPGHGLPPGSVPPQPPQPAYAYGGLPPPTGPPPKYT
ncbi:hypothetical protein MPDQ_003099 [Monascus purpureus]|uniref:Rhodopsin family protein n=1 Tax=Monascus purpureus TaxID=5098 RepID=A0A507R1X4_MONPU|nr:hypothetical protein MPDQ_003099 [Monascus purpureus]BDD54616.1 hypothetical protein MAP00_000217 [Monascus purpureus]